MGNTYDLSNKRAIVTGAAKSIGRAVAELFVQSGAQVVIWDRDRADVPGCSASIVDVTRIASIRQALAELGDAPRIDVLVNCAGYIGLTRPFISHDPDEWQKIIDVNLAGTLHVTQAVLPCMLRERSGRIVNFGSLAGKEGLAGLAAYSAASGGVISFTKALSREVAQHGVFVNCVAPGPVDTDMIRNLGAQAVDQMIADSPLRRLGQVQEVAQLVAWLCSEASRFNTGAVFDMSGGRARY